MHRNKITSMAAAVAVCLGMLVAVVASAASAGAYTASTNCGLVQSPSVAQMSTGPSGTYHFVGVKAALRALPTGSASTGVPVWSVCSSAGGSTPALNRQAYAYIELQDTHGHYMIEGILPGLGSGHSCPPDAAGNVASQLYNDVNGVYSFVQCDAAGTGIDLSIAYDSVHTCYQMGGGTGPCYTVAQNGFSGPTDAAVANMVGYGATSDMYGDATYPTSEPGSGVLTFNDIAVQNTAFAWTDACTALGSAPADPFTLRTITGASFARFAESKDNCDTFTSQTISNP